MPCSTRCSSSSKWPRPGGWSRTWETICDSRDRAQRQSRPGAPKTCNQVAAQPGCTSRNCLTGIEHALRVEELLQPAVERHEIAVLALEVGELAEADAMLAGARAAAR